MSFSFKILPTCVIFPFKILPTSAIFSLWEERGVTQVLCRFRRIRSNTEAHFISRILDLRATCRWRAAKYCLPVCVILFQNTAYLPIFFSFKLLPTSAIVFSSKILPTCVIFSAARLLLSRIGGIYDTRVRIKMATARLEKSRR